jgi:hypothetical protein
MRVGVGITMFNEHVTVLRTVKNIIGCESFTPYIVLVHSDDGDKSKELEEIRELVDEYVLLPNLGSEYSGPQLAAHCITRNYSSVFNALNKKKFDVVVGLTGDTLVTDPTNFIRRSQELEQEKKVAFVAQAIGQRFHSPDGPDEGREQHPHITDIMPQLFILEGKFSYDTKCFSTIEIVNKFTSEHCLGDELVSKIGKSNWRDKVVKLNRVQPTNAYYYNDGVQYHIT